MLTEREKDKIRQDIIRISNELLKWPEDKVKSLLKERLEREGWNVNTISLGYEKGRDLEAQKGDLTIIIEAKGEPKSPLTYLVQRRSYVQGALASIAAWMKEENPKTRYLIAFPENGYYPRGVKNLIPALVRKKLGLLAVFINEDSSVETLFPYSDEVTQLNRFDDLFSKR